MPDQLHTLPSALVSVFIGFLLVAFGIQVSRRWRGIRHIVDDRTGGGISLIVPDRRRFIPCTIHHRPDRSGNVYSALIFNMGRQPHRRQRHLYFGGHISGLFVEEVEVTDCLLSMARFIWTRAESVCPAAASEAMA